MWRFVILFFVLMPPLSLVVAQTTTKSLILPTPTPVPSTPPPGDIKLLPDFVHTQKRGIDTSVGEIKGPDGLLIRYDNGRLAGNVAWRMYAELPRRNVGVTWYREQKVSGLTLYLIKGEDQSIYATFPETCANFYAFNVNEQGLVDFLLMIMTYHREPNKDVQIKNGRPTC